MSTYFNNFTETELTNERWRDVDGYDGMYQVSDLGRVRSKHSGEWKVMRASKDKNGYLRLSLSKDGKHKRFSVHRLVAQAFIYNDDETKISINHIDECKQNNKVSNLEYCTVLYNNTYNDLRRRCREHNSKRNEIKELYDPNMSIADNIKLFKSNGIDCSRNTVVRLRKDLKLERPRYYPVRRKIEKLYDPELSIDDNIKLFRSNGIECSEKTVYELRKELGITRKHKFRNELKDLYNPDLSYNENLKVFKENGVECSKKIIFNIRKDLGLSRPRKKTN